MLSLTQYQYKVSANTALTLTGLSIAPIVGAFRHLQESKSVDATLPTLNPPAESNDWTEWLLSGYLGNFLAWTGKQLAHIGSNVFPAPNKSERLQIMRAYEEGLKQFLSEKMLGKDVDDDISAALNTYLRSGRSLIKEESLEAAEWQEELKNLRSFAIMAGDENTVTILSEWIKRLNSLQKNNELLTEKQIDSKASRVASHLILNRNMMSDSEDSDLFHNGKRLGFTLDLATLGNAGFTINGVYAGDFSGYAVSGAGDVNGDGIADVVIGALGATGDTAYSGVSYVIFGSKSVTLAGSTIDLATLSSSKAGFTINGAQANGWSGRSVGAAGDVNADGFSDIIIGAPIAYGDAPNSGVSYVIFGSNSTALAGSVIDLATLSSSKAGFTINGVNGRSGESVSGAGDVNKDGFADVIIGAWYATGDALQSGVSYVVFGNNSMVLAGSVIDLATLSNSKAGFTINGADAYDNFGYSVSGAGDVNGDGFADVIIGAPSATGDEAFSGVSYVIFGNYSEILAGSVIDLAILNSTKVGFKINGANSSHVSGHSDFSGSSVSGAGDVNGDGFADVIIGAPDAHTFNGASYVVFGNNSTSLAGSTIHLTTLSASKAGFVINGVNVNDYSGSSVSGAGDLNGDGYADIIIGAPEATGDAVVSGISYVVFGSNAVDLPGSSIDLATLRSNVGFTIKGVDFAGHLGRSVSGAGDVNGDGFADVIIGAYYATGDVAHSGKSYVVFGSILTPTPSPTPSPTPTPTPTPTPSPIPISMPTPVPTPSHKHPVDLSDTDEGVAIFDANGADDELGCSLSSVGDVNDDGIDDFVIGARNALKNKHNRSVREPAEVVLMNHNGSLHVSSIKPTVSMSYSKSEEDESVEETQEWGAGEIYLVLGNEQFANPLTITIYGAKPGDQAGYAVGAAGDVNGDGVPDIIIGAPKSSPHGLEHAGTSYVVFGWNGFKKSINLSKLNGKSGFRVEGIAAENESGYSVSGAGDVNGDGYDDVIIGAPLASPHGKEEAGEAYVVFGKNRFDARVSLSELNGANGFRLSGISSGERCGGAVSRAGDMNGDGYDDVVIGARRGLDYAGRSYVVFGQDSFDKHMSLGWLNGANGFVIRGKERKDLSGGSVSLAGDMNGDGYDDIVIGAHHATPNIWREEAGEAYVIFGGASFSSSFALSSLDGTNGFQINGKSKENYLGKSVHGARDVNQDGYADIILGANGANGNSRKKSGKSYVIFGQEGAFTTPFEVSSLDGTNGFEIDGAHRYDGSGFAVSGAGDVDHDGYDDVLVGAWRASPHKHQKHAGEAFLVFGGTKARRIEEGRMMSMPSGKTNRYGFFVSVGINGTVASVQKENQQARLGLS